MWRTMLEDATYRIWTATFMPGSYFEGDWREGSTMRFLAKHEDSDKVSGMKAHVRANKTHEFISLEHFAEIHEDVEHPWAETGFENYTFRESADGTTVIVDMLNVPDEYAGMFEESWPAALIQLKELAEQASS